MSRPEWISQEELYKLNNSHKAWDWMFHDYLVFRFAGKHTKKEMLRKLRINRFQYYRLTVRMSTYLTANNIAECETTDDVATNQGIECANFDV